jgi:hypothetical protein
MAEEDVVIGGKTFAADLVTVEGEIKRVSRDKIGWGAPGTYGDVADADGARLPVDSPTLAGKLDTLKTAVDALESITATLDPASLAALENITAALEPGTLAALEAITATLDAGTLTGLAGPAAPVNLPGASGAVTAVDGRLMGFSVREAAGTPAKAAMRLRAGSATGAILATVTLAPEESVRDWFGPNGITATGGVYYELVSGTITGGVQTR